MKINVLIINSTYKFPLYNIQKLQQITKLFLPGSVDA